MIALLAALVAYGVVIGAPRWHAYVIRHAGIDRLRAMCAETGGAVDVAACTTLGQRLIAARRPHDAVDPLRAAVDRLEKDPSRVSSRDRAALSGTLAEALMLDGRGVEANPYFTSAIKLDDECVPAHLAFGLWLEGLRYYKLAKNELTIVTTLDPRNDMGWFLLAHINNGENTLDKAREYAQKAIAINPRMPNYWQELGDSYGYAGHFRESLPAYREELKLDPTSVSAQADVARAMALGANTPEEYTEALSRFTTVMRLKDLEAGPAYYLIGTLHMKFGHYKEARAALEKCVRLDGTLPENYYSLALARKLTGDPKGSAQAMAHFNLLETHYRHTQTVQKQLSERPNEVSLHLEIAKEWEWYRNWPDALVEYKKAAKLRPGDPLVARKIQEITPLVANRPQPPLNAALSRLMNANHAIVLQENRGATGYPAASPGAAPSGKP